MPAAKAGILRGDGTSASPWGVDSPWALLFQLDGASAGEAHVVAFVEPESSPSPDGESAMGLVLLPCRTSTQESSSLPGDAVIAAPKVGPGQCLDAVLKTGPVTHLLAMVSDGILAPHQVEGSGDMVISLYSSVPASLVEPPAASCSIHGEACPLRQLSSKMEKFEAVMDERIRHLQNLLLEERAPC